MNSTSRLVAASSAVFLLCGNVPPIDPLDSEQNYCGAVPTPQTSDQKNSRRLIKSLVPKTLGSVTSLSTADIFPSDVRLSRPFAAIHVEKDQSTGLVIRRLEVTFAYESSIFSEIDSFNITRFDVQIGQEKIQLFSVINDPKAITDCSSENYTKHAGAFTEFGKYFACRAVVKSFSDLTNDQYRKMLDAVPGEYIEINLFRKNRDEYSCRLFINHERIELLDFSIK